MNTISERATSGMLNGLIVACNDDIRAHNAAARAVTGERKHRLEDSARTRATFVHELGQLVRDLGAEPTTGGSLTEAVFGSLATLRSLLIGHHAGDGYSVCARVEGNTEALYDRALHARLPDSVRVVLERQHAEIASDREELRRRRIL